jgi:ABC-2 type transport system ATP-binding protein
VDDDGYGVVTRGVTRRFGSVEALRGLDLTVPYGQVTALVGPNGAGKTTLLLVLATLLRPDSGEVRVAGYDPVADPVAVRATTGWMPDVFGVYDQLTVQEYLAFFADTSRGSCCSTSPRPAWIHGPGSSCATCCAAWPRRAAPCWCPATS